MPGTLPEPVGKTNLKTDMDKGKVICSKYTTNGHQSKKYVKRTFCTT